MAAHVVLVESAQQVFLPAQGRVTLGARSLDHLLQFALFFVEKIDQPFHPAVAVPLVASQVNQIQLVVVAEQALWQCLQFVVVERSTMKIIIIINNNLFIYKLV